MAVGAVFDQEDNSYPFAEVLSQGTWSPEILPLPTNADAAHGGGATLDSVSCPSDGMCVAVGAYGDISTYQSGLLESLSSGVWSDRQAPLPVRQDTGLVNVNSVSCSDPTTCEAVGAYQGTSTYVLAYGFQSGSWSLQTFGNGGPSQPPLVPYGVSCPADGACVAVGSVNVYPRSGFIATLAPGTWSVVAAPSPSGSLQEDLDTVDCADIGDCVAGGAYDPAPTGNATQLLLELSQGTWTATVPPVPADAQPSPGAGITGVYCPAAAPAGSLNAPHVRRPVRPPRRDPRPPPQPRPT